VGFGLKNMGSAQLDRLAVPEEYAPQEQSATETSTQAAVPAANGPLDLGPLDLRQQAAARLAAHRERRALGNRRAEAPEVASQRALRPRHNPIVEAVTERFAHSPSYRAVLAEQAQRAIEQAARDAEAAATEAQNAFAEAQIAQRNADAIAQAQQQLIAELNLWDAPQQFTAESARTHSATEPEARATHPRVEKTSQPDQPVQEISTAGLTVRLYEDLGPSQAAPARSKSNFSSTEALDPEEARALDEEIAFRQAPVFEPFTIDPLTPLPAKLLEFPRELIAARKARPRIAEGPLREEPAPRSPQLRIFEVEPEQISIIPTEPSVNPEWASIHLDAQPETRPVPSATQTAAEAAAEAAAPALLPSMLPPQTAPLELRLMATTVDLLLVTTGAMAFTAVAAQILTHLAVRLPVGVPAALAVAVIFAILWPLYQTLFFTFSDQTPGMRYARIGLCTLTDENPTRRAMRRRIFAQLIALTPFALGFLWALLDDDGLGWHDRISRMYQRAY
jgi:uncharacterized RDD family membrane protein YckC